jgi:diguanylate cyclase (GGDEF)-like protein
MVRAPSLPSCLEGDPSLEGLLGLIYVLPVGIAKFRADGRIDLINPLASEALLRLRGDNTLSNIYTALSGQIPDLRSHILGFAGTSGRISGEMQLLVGSNPFSLNIHKIDEFSYLAILQDASELAKLNERLKEDNEKQKRQEEEIRTIGMQFSEALNNISQGISMFDSRQRIVVASRRFCEIYRLIPDQVKPGTTLRHILEQRQINGTDFGQDIDKYVHLFNPTLESETHHLLDGRIISIARHPLPDGGWVATHEDITERNRIDERLAFMALHDDLTGLPNRALLTEKLSESVALMQRQDAPFSVLLLDLDKFKHVNDTLGHPLGDELLREVSERLQKTLGEDDVLARLGGDEFGIIQPAAKSQRESAIALALRIEETLTAPFSLNGNRVNIGASIGITMAQDREVTSHDLLKQADLALYRAKSEKRDCYSFFSTDLIKEAEARRSLEVEMREAINNKEFELHYQAVFAADTCEIAGVEALVRWRHPTKGLVPPDQFIPLAEETGLIVPLGEWILQKACHDGAKWPEHVKIAVNLSAVQFRAGKLFDVILCALVESGLNPRRLELEITESVLLGNEDDYMTTIRQLKNIGVSFALDDFGTGYSSLSYLTRFPFDKIKIDRSFTRGFGTQKSCDAIVSSVIVLARGLNIATTAEGVETEEQYKLLRGAGVDLLQGYLFARPVLPTELKLTRWRSPDRASPQAA